jgi:general secretion pathway protein D
MKKIAVIVILALALWGCLPLSRDYRLGTRAEMNKQYEAAIQYYEKAALADPKESVYRLALARAKAAASLFHLQNARALVAQGKKKEAETEYAFALLYDPLNRTIAAEMNALEAPPAKPEKPASAVMEAPVKLKSAAEKLNVDFRVPVSLRSIFETLGRTSGVTFIYDDSFRDTNLAVDLRGKDIEQAIGYLCIAAKMFYRVIDEKTVVIAADNVMTRQKYELQVIRTFYLSNINAQDVQQALFGMLRATQFKSAPIMTIDKTLNSITIRDTPETVAMAEKLLRSWDKSQGEVVVAVEIMEVDRTLLRKLGIDFSNTSLNVQLNPETSPGSASGWVNLSGLKLGSLSSYEISNPLVAVQFLEGDSHTKIVAQPRIRGVDGQDMKYLVGQKVPIPTSTFTPIMAGGSNAQPIVQYNLQDVGIELNMKPRIHLEKEVTLEVEIKVSSISGAGYADIPIINTREIKNTIRLKDGETNLLAGLLRDEERKSIGGITGLKDIPILGSLFSATETTIDQTDVVLMITPYIIRSLSLTEADSKPLWVDPSSLGGVSAAGQGGTEQGLSEQAALQQNEPPVPQEEPGASAVYLSPASFEINRGREFRINVELATEKEIGNMSLNVGFDPQILKLKEVIEGGVARQLGSDAKFLSLPTESGCSLGFSAPTLGRGFKGQGILAVLVFTPANPGETTVSISSCSATGVTGQAVVLETGESKIVIR